MNNAINKISEPAVCPSIAYIVWEDFGTVNIHHSTGGKYYLLWQVTGMEKPETVEYATFEESLRNGLDVVEGTPDQALIAIDGSDNTFVELSLDSDDKERMVSEALAARMGSEKEGEKPCSLVTILSSLFKRKETVRIDSDGE